MRGFASDNYAGVHPEVMTAIAEANVGHARAYGYDDITAEAERLMRHHFGEHVRAFPVFNGTGANVSGLQSMLKRHQAIVCSPFAHINTDEAGAAERHLGSKLLLVDAPDGRLTPEAVDEVLGGRRDEHQVQPAVLSLTQSTELGTVYSPPALRILIDLAHERGLLVHIDGARIANAAASLGVPIGEAVEGADVVSFGGTKNGAMGAEVVVFLNPTLADDYLFVRKQSMQLSSKMRYTSAQLVALLRDDLWHRNADHANAMARRLFTAVSEIDDVTVTQPVQANAVFATMPRNAIAPLQEKFPFYVWNDMTNEVRWVCSWDTTEEDVDTFASTLAELVSR